MPRPKRSTELVDQPFPEMSDLDPDPQPVAARRGPGRPRKATTTGARGPGKIPARTSSGRVMSKAAMETKVRAEITTYLTLANAAFSLRDPECAAIVEAQIPEITDRAVALIARNESVLAVVAKSGIIGDILALVSALFPILRQMWAVHGPGGKGHDLDESRGSIDADRYAPYTG